MLRGRLKNLKLKDSLELICMGHISSGSSACSWKKHLRHSFDLQVDEMTLISQTCVVLTRQKNLQIDDVLFRGPFYFCKKTENYVTV
jgi:hypothetical protein